MDFLGGVKYDFKPTAVALAEAEYASKFYEHLVRMINEFEEDLDDEHEAGIRLVSFGQTIQFHVVDIGYQNPSIIIFYGITENGQKVQLIQNVSQLSFLLMTMKRLNPEEPKRKIGFEPEEE